MVLASAVVAEDISDLISHGDLQRAGDSLKSLSSAEQRNGNMLYYAGLLEPDGARAAALMAAALESSVSAVHREEIINHLASYYALQGDYDKLSETVNRYFEQYESGRYRWSMLRYAVMLDEQKQQPEQALSRLERYLKEFDDGDREQWGLIDKVRLLRQQSRFNDTNDILRRLSRQKNGPGVPLSLYLLALDAVAAQKTDDAVRYFDLMRDGYPAGVGLDALGELIMRLGSPETPQTEPEVPPKLPEGKYFAVQVGVFSIAANAYRQAKLFERPDLPAEVVEKTTAEKRYFAVFVGKFPTYEAALTFKRQLEREHEETFQVVTR